MASTRGVEEAADPAADRLRPRRRPRRTSAKKRATILTAARELFVKGGVGHVSMDAVAAAAQVSKATLYSHFGSKQHLFPAILAEVSEALDGSVGGEQALCYLFH
ncbi:helix-turn-helix domain-containing protein [Streptomyces sp. NPDC001185]|uniref:TetR/AcrR family transcriptional regulator n=1 Tax=Streptomyces sp. NPDC001185 TaxID=3154380 RepID=UPI00332E16CA